jgi:hypothetical protein
MAAVPLILTIRDQLQYLHFLSPQQICAEKAAAKGNNQVQFLS